MGLLALEGYVLWDLRPFEYEPLLKLVGWKGVAFIRLWLLSALAMVLLTLLGMAGESLGYDRMLKANTVKKRRHSLFRQGMMLYELMPMMPEGRLRPLVERFGEMLLGHRTFTAVLGLA